MVLPMMSGRKDEALIVHPRWEVGQHSARVHRVVRGLPGNHDSVSLQTIAAENPCVGDRVARSRGINAGAESVAGERMQLACYQVTLGRKTIGGNAVAWIGLPPGGFW